MWPSVRSSVYTEVGTLNQGEAHISTVGRGPMRTTFGLFVSGRSSASTGLDSVPLQLYYLFKSMANLPALITMSL